MSTKLISLKVPVYTLERIDAVAKQRGITRTGLLLEPWFPKNPYVTVEAFTSAKPAHDPTCKCLMCRPSKI